MAQSSQAVLWSLLSLAVYHQDGDLDCADKLRESAVQLLLGLIKPTMDAHAAIEHIAAGLLLCIVEERRNSVQITAFRLTRSRSKDQAKTLSGWASFAAQR